MAEGPEHRGSDWQGATPRGELMRTEPAIRAAATTSTTRAAFLSQLIAERFHLDPQRERRRAPVPFAIDIYAAAQQQAVRRLPPGYRKTVVV